MEKNQSENFGFKEIKRGVRDIFKHTKQYKNKLIFIFVLIIISSSIDAISPYVWGKLIDATNSKSLFHFYGYSFKLVFVILLSYILLLIIQNLVNLRQSLESNYVEESVRTTYLANSYAHIFRLPISFHKNVKSGETGEKVRNAAQAIDNIFSNSILGTIPSLATATIMYIILLFINIEIGLIITIALIGYIYFSVKEVKPTIALQKESQRSYRKASGIIQDALLNVKTVKDFNTEDYEFNRIDSVYKNEAMVAWYKIFSLQRQTSSMQGYIRTAVQAGVLLISIMLISKGQLTIGSMLAYNTYALMIFQPLSSIINGWRNIQNGIVSIEDAEAMLNIEKEKYKPENQINLTDLEGKVSFENVSFHYDKEKVVLQNISLTVNPGETIALVGESGVGKSTLIDLISGYYFPEEGTIAFDNVDVRQINLNTLRKNIAVVSQEISLFNDTILNNLTYGSFDRTTDEIMAAAVKAHCADFIEKFPLKYEQIVGEKGLKLSVGQKQRVAIARAILRNPKILILDEPTSALDAGSENIITQSLEELMKGKTTFIIAHRLSTVRKANKILVFKEGRIIEQGTHNELIKIAGGEYRRLYELQIGLHS